MVRSAYQVLVCFFRLSLKVTSVLWGGVMMDTDCVCGVCGGWGGGNGLLSDTFVTKTMDGDLLNSSTCTMHTGSLSDKTEEMVHPRGLEPLLACVNLEDIT